MTTAIEPVGGWPAELANGSEKEWHAVMRPWDFALKAAHMRLAWMYLQQGATSEDMVGPNHRAWDVITRVLKRHNLIRYNRETRRWEALRVPA